MPLNSPVARVPSPFLPNHKTESEKDRVTGPQTHSHQFPKEFGSKSHSSLSSFHCGIFRQSTQVNQILSEFLLAFGVLHQQPSNLPRSQKDHVCAQHGIYNYQKWLQITKTGRGHIHISILSLSWTPPLLVHGLSMNPMAHAHGWGGERPPAYEYGANLLRNMWLLRRKDATNWTNAPNFPCALPLFDHAREKVHDINRERTDRMLQWESNPEVASEGLNLHLTDNIGGARPC